MADKTPIFSGQLVHIMAWLRRMMRRDYTIGMININSVSKIFLPETRIVEEFGVIGKYQVGVDKIFSSDIRTHQRTDFHASAFSGFDPIGRILKGNAVARVNVQSFRA